MDGLMPLQHQMITKDPGQLDVSLHNRGQQCQ
jgi:hypothetical protein